MNARPFGFQTDGLQEVHNVAAENGIVIENRVAIRSGFRKGLAELLHDPICGRLPGGVEMQDSAPLVLDDEETVQDSERRRRHGEEVEGNNRLAVVVGGWT